MLLIKRIEIKHGINTCIPRCRDAEGLDKRNTRNQKSNHPPIDGQIKDASEAQGYARAGLGRTRNCFSF